MFLFFWCKDTMFFASTVGISPKGVGENPYFFILCLRSSIYRYRTGEERKGLREVFRCFWNNQTKYLLPLHSEKNNLMNRLEFKTESKIIKTK